MLAENTCLSFFHIFFYWKTMFWEKNNYDRKTIIFFISQIQHSNTDWRPTGAAMASAIYR